YIPMSLHLIISALIPIYTGAHASLSRPSSAASPPPRKRKRSASSTSSSSSSDDEDESTVKMEGLSPSDAVVFPLIAGATLVGFYVLIKYFGPQLLNKVLGIYFSFMACFSVGKMVADLVRVGEGFVWPAYYVDQGRVWRVRQAEKRVEAVGGEEGERKSPLPGRWGRMELGDALVGWAWFARGLLSKEYEVKLRFRGTTALKAKLSLRAVTAGFFGVAVVLYANLVDTPWYLTNLQGFAFSYAALQLLSPTTFATGSLILVALFFYDIYFVFYTPIMVSVATNLDIPIKMLFPRPETEDKKPSLAMLGLGDVVLPGIMIGLALRFDLYLHYLRRQTKKDKSSGQTESIGEDISSSEKRLTDQEILKLPYVPATTRWGERFWTLGWTNNTGTGSGSKTITSIVPRFKKTYFYASIVGYVIGMTTTLVVMHVFKHAQPALLYLVPGVLGSVWLTALVRGEVKDMWAYTEMVEEEDEKEDGK
ncbi:peptidase A22B, signal peptide peptidase, partial [Myriangium duriaei CBS 260.36]